MKFHWLSKAIDDDDDYAHQFPWDEVTEPKNIMQNTAERIAKKEKFKEVVFTNADIVEFEPTLYTASVTSGGVPLGISRTERCRVRRRLDSFENERAYSRVTRENYMNDGYLSPEERERILGNVCGVKENEIVQTETEVHEIIDNRIDSNQNDTQYSISELRTMSWMHFIQASNEEDDDDDDIITSSSDEEFSITRPAEKVQKIVFKVPCDDDE